MFKLSLHVSLIGGILCLAMVRLSYWQWERYLEKQGFLSELDKRLKLPIIPLEELISDPKNPPPPEKLLHRRVSVTGNYDFSHEIVRRNRRDEEDGPGVHLITPLKLADSDIHLLVNRGFVPLSAKSREKRKLFHNPAETSFIGLIKLPETRSSILAPADDTASREKPWIDEWLRVDVPAIQKQLPYPLFPFYVEIIATTEQEAIQQELVKNSNARNEIFYLSDSMSKVSMGKLNPNRSYPIPAFSTVVPSATHLLYVFEWGFMALMTIIATILLQLKRAAPNKPYQESEPAP